MKGSDLMYGENNNNNNYTYTADYSPEPSAPPKNGTAGKTLALVLAAVIAGGASGYGGAYLANKSAGSEPSMTVSAGTDKSGEQNEEAINIVTAAPQETGNGDKSIGALLSRDDNASGELSNEEIIQRCTPSVVLITTTFTEAGKRSGGTGIVISSDGYIITNCHVIETTYSTYENSGSPFGFFGYGYNAVKKTVKADEVTITMSDGSEHKAEIVGSDESTDLALLKIDAKGLIPAVIGNSDELKLGEKAITLGYPLGLGLSASCGIVSGLDRERTVELSSGKTARMTLIQTDAVINSGNSGGPLINSRGEVIGVTSSKLVNGTVEGVAFAIPITGAMSVLDDLMDKGYVSLPKIGITGGKVTAAVQRYYNLPVEKGVFVETVEEGSAAEAAGIAAGDVIVAADGKEITDMESLVIARNAHKSGEIMTLTLARNGGNIDVEVILDEKPKDE